jgi:hypothetical protein
LASDIWLKKLAFCAELVMGLGALRRLRHGILQQVDGLLRVTGLERGFALRNQRVGGIGAEERESEQKNQYRTNQS